MALIEVPERLTKACWDRKKGAVPAGSPLEAGLKAFEKKLQAVEWRSFEPGWEKKAADPKALDAAWTALERTWQSKVVPLKAEAQSVAEAAQKLLKDKSLPKPTLEAAKSVVDEARTFARSIDAAWNVLDKLHDDAARAFEDSGGEGEAEAPVAELLDPGLLHRYLEACRKTPGRRMHFAFASDGKTPPTLVMAPRTAGRKLFSTLTDATGVRAGGYGQAWFEEGVLYLMMEKPFPGIVKKIREPLKAARFKVRKVVLVAEGGQVVEQDEVAGEDGGEPAPDAAADRAAPASTAYADRLAGLMPRVGQARSAGQPVAAKIGSLLDFAQAKAEAGNEAVALQTLQALEKLLDATPVAAQAAEQWEQRRQAIEARVAAALSAGVPESAKLGKVLGFALDKARAGQFDTAVAAVASLEAMLADVDARVGAEAASTGRPGPVEGAAPGELIEVWTTAKEQVDERINTLREALLGYGDADLARIANEGITEAGLAFLTGGRLVELMASLIDLRGRTAVDPALTDRASRAVLDLKTFLEKDEIVGLCDDNPLTDSPLGIRSSLIPALERIESRLRAVS